MYCLKCGYCLDHLPSDECPECGGLFEVGNHSTYSQSPNGWKYRRRIKWAVAITSIAVGTLLIAPVVLYNLERLSFYYAAWSQGGASITKLHGYIDEPGFDVTSIDLDVHGKGPMSFSCYLARDFQAAKEVKLIGIGPHRISDINHVLLANGMLSEYQVRMLGHFPGRPVESVNIGVGGECSGLASTPVNSIGDAISQYDDILRNIEVLIQAEEDRQATSDQ